MRVLAATLTAVSLVGVMVGAAGAAPARTAKLTAVEQRWVTPVIRLWNTENGGLLVVLSQATAANGGALIPGTKANAALLGTLSQFVECTPMLARAKSPPSPRLVPFANAMKSACTDLVTGAHGVASGIASLTKHRNEKLGTAQLQAAFQNFKLASAKLALARKQLLAVGGKAAFTA
jgi:hypothetical protein